MVVVTLVFFVATALSVAVPVRQALRVDPAAALREE